MKMWTGAALQTWAPLRLAKRTSTKMLGTAVPPELVMCSPRVPLPPLAASRLLVVERRWLGRLLIAWTRVALRAERRWRANRWLVVWRPTAVWWKSLELRSALAVVKAPTQRGR